MSFNPQNGHTFWIKDSWLWQVKLLAQGHTGSKWQMQDYETKCIALNHLYILQWEEDEKKEVIGGRGESKGREKP